MFKMIVGLLAFSIASAYALTGCHHGHCKSFEKWETSGVYTIRVWHSSENSIQVYRRYGFRKLYDANQRKYRVDAYPLSPADGHEFPVSATGRGPLGPFVVMSTGNEIMVIEEREKGGVKCRRFERRFRKHDPVKTAKYAGLSFEHNELANHYTNLQMNESPHCKFTQTDLWLDSFTRSPVAMHLEGVCRMPSVMQFQSSDEINRRQVGAGRRFIIDIVVNEFQERIENEKEWFSIPHNVQQVCRGEDLMSDAGEYGELLNAMDSI